MGSKFPKVQKRNSFSELIFYIFYLPEINISGLNLPQTYRNEMMTHCYIYIYFAPITIRRLSIISRIRAEQCSTPPPQLKIPKQLHSVSPNEIPHQPTVARRFCECHLNRSSLRIVGFEVHPTLVFL